ncbi:MAG: PCYCGC domain-containing protein [Anaerolineae bacterium]|nr:PCYCGC domain-containing protein [Anaerolineae bacterium]
MSQRAILILCILLFGGLVLTACAGREQPRPQVKLAPVSALPEPMQRAPATVRTAYQFAIANPDALANVPCYCGCGAIGHKSNLACYVRQFDAAGRPVFDTHALGCSICVDIALDVMKMTGEGKPPAEIRQRIVETYSKFGPGNQ